MSLGSWVESNKPRQAKKSEVFFGWLRNNRETFWGTLAIIIAIIVFSIVFIVNYTKAQKLAWQSLFMAQQNAYSGNFDEALKITDKLVKSYGRSSAVPFAHLLNGDLYFSQGKYEEAEKAYNEAGKKADKILAPVVAFNIGKTFEARHKWEDAEKIYSDFLQKYPLHYTAPEVHLSLATVYVRSNKNNEAKAAFEKISVLYPDTIWAAQAKSVLNPETAKKAASKKKSSKK